MSESEVTAKLKKLFSDMFDVPEDEISDDSSPDTIEKWDSFQYVMFISATEETFNISFTADEIAEIITFGSVKDLTIKYATNR